MLEKERSGGVPVSCQSSNALGTQMQEDCTCFSCSTLPGGFTWLCKPLTPHGRWWTRGSPRYQVLSLWHPTLDMVEELRTE